MRADTLAERIDNVRLTGKSAPVEALPAEELYRTDGQFMTGQNVFETFGCLMTYVPLEAVDSIRESGLGTTSGLWLTPTVYAACVAPYRLGLPTPRDVCVVVNPQHLEKLWGPGTAGPSKSPPAQRTWIGGAVEFFVPRPISFGDVLAFVAINTCGDM